MNLQQVVAAALAAEAADGRRWTPDTNAQFG
jgi:hypothetical protein